MTDGDLISRQAVEVAIAETIVNGESLGYGVAYDILSDIPSVKTDGDLYRCSICGRSIILYKGVSPKIHPYCCNTKMKPIVRGELVKNGSLTSEELFDLDIEQNVKDIDSGEDDSYYRGRLAGMLSAYRILKGKPYEEKETEGAK